MGFLLNPPSLANAGIASGENNTALGTGALGANESKDNTAYGTRALKANTTGERNTAIGSEALTNNTTGAKNTALGYAALTASKKAEKNVAVGASALAATVEGSFNTAVGWTALNRTTSEKNTAVGMEASIANVAGKQNVALGYAALAENLEGDGNTAVGVTALGLNSGGPGSETADKGKSAKNTALGFHAGQLNNAESNVFLGYEAGAQELGSSLLYIANTNTKEPLIKGDFSAKTLAVSGTLTATIAAAKPTASEVIAKEVSTKASTTKLAWVYGFGTGAALTRTKVEFIVNGVPSQKFTISASSAGTTATPFGFIVPANTSWEWKLVEGNIENMNVSTTLIG
jgi:hypothetical protein